MAATQAMPIEMHLIQSKVGEGLQAQDYSMKRADKKRAGPDALLLKRHDPESPMRLRSIVV